MEQTLGNARAIGITAALTGPLTRGDAGTLQAHLAELEAACPRRARALPRARPAGAGAGRSPWRAGTGGRRTGASLTCKPGLNQYDWPHAAQHRREVRGTAGRELRPAHLARPRAPTRPARHGLVPARVGAGHRAAPGGPAAPRPAPRQLARGAARPDAAPGRWPPSPRRLDEVGGIRSIRRGSPVRRRPGAVARLRNSTATSAGGIVIRYESGVPQFVAGRRRRESDGTWTLPKGTPEAGETTEQTALREVAEETGLTVRILAPFDSIAYTFVQRGTRIHKTVHYFLMAPDRRRPGRSRPRVRRGALDPARRGAGDPDLRDGARARRPGGRAPGGRAAASAPERPATGTTAPSGDPAPAAPGPMNEPAR